MHLSNLLPQKKFKIPFILAFVLTFLSLFPLLVVGKDAVFFNIDPDVVYVANAINYFKTHIVYYHDHPGIPAIFLIFLTLIPFRVIAFINHLNFFELIFNNFSLVFIYLRAMSALLFFGGLSLYFLVIYKFTKSYWATFFSFLLLLNFLPVIYLGVSISAETLNFLLVTVWIYLFMKSGKNKNYINYLMLASGFLFANRATNFFYVVAGFSLLKPEKNSIKKAFLMGVGLLIGLLPSYKIIIAVLKRVLFFAFSSGVHGTGSGKFFEPDIYLQSLMTFIDRDTIFTLTLLLTIISVIYFRKKLNGTSIKPIVIIAFGSFLFAKFPLAHYQIPNYQFVVFMASFIFLQFPKLFQYALILILIFTGYRSYLSYLNINTREMQQVALFERYTRENKSNKGTVYEWARSGEFSLLWANNYGGGMFNAALDKKYPKLYLLDSDIFSRCWDSLYIQEASLKDFLILNEDKHLESEKIDGSQGLNLIKSDHCLTKP